MRQQRRRSTESIHLAMTQRQRDRTRCLHHQPSPAFLRRGRETQGQPPCRNDSRSRAVQRSSVRGGEVIACACTPCVPFGDMGSAQRVRELSGMLKKPQQCAFKQWYLQPHDEVSGGMFISIEE